VILRLLCPMVVMMLAVQAPLAAGSRHAPKQNAPPVPISILINGTALPVDPPPRYVHANLLVPVRKILDALGLPFDRAGNTITTTVSDRSVALVPGSRRAVVNGGVVVLETAPLEIKGILYAPLRFFTDAIGAQAHYDPRSKVVEITSSLVGHSGVVNAQGANREYMGIVEAVDNDSQPPSITVSEGASVKTVSIRGNPRVAITDVVANTSVAGALQDVHVGDYAKIAVRKDGTIEHIVDSFASRHEEIAAMAGNTLVLADGHVITPTGVTSLSLNGEGAKVSDLAVGDDVVVRYNLDTAEVREIIASRRPSRALPGAGSVAITSIEPSAARALRPGDSFEVVLKGSPHGQASYDIGSYFTNLPMSESQFGVYSARYTVPQGANFAAAPLFGHLAVGGTAAPRAQSQTEISAASTPPGIVDFAPDQSQVINNNQPSIYATFAAGVIPVNTSSIVLVVNGHDLTASATRTAAFIEYHSAVEFSDGPVHVTVRVSDTAGNTATKAWTFFVKSHQ